VDNVLVKVGDPLFMGVRQQSVEEGFPDEAVGITAKVNRHFQVVEYSEITPKSAEKRNKDGSLV
jgi:UDP-N-acetylglucosamine/UDP-N-acetylgalactosamine diphosphorylase